MIESQQEDNTFSIYIQLDISWLMTDNLRFHVNHSSDQENYEDSLLSWLFSDKGVFLSLGAKVAKGITGN